MFHLFQVFNDRGGYGASSRDGSFSNRVFLPDQNLFRIRQVPAVVELIGIEPTTSGLQSPRSPS
jgi:hypothetical protein